MKSSIGGNYGSPRKTIQSRFKQSNINTNLQSIFKPKNSNHIDRQSIVEQYQTLRSRHQEQLSKINMPDRYKRQLFGYSQSYYCTNKAQNTELVVVNDFFKGKLVMKQSQWQKIKESKKQKHQSDKKRFNSEDQFAKLDISIEKTNSPAKKTNSPTKKSAINQKYLTQGTLIQDNLEGILHKVNRYDGLENDAATFQNNLSDKNISVSSIQQKQSIDFGDQMENRKTS